MTESSINPSLLTSGSTGVNNEAQQTQKPRTAPFSPDSADGLLALASLLLGFLFMRWVFFAWQGWGVTLFTALYAGAVLLYLRQKGISMSRTAWFWLIVLQLTGLSYALWQGRGLQPWRELFLFGSAVYWVLNTTQMTLLPQTSDWLPLDMLHGLLVIPFRSFGAAQVRSVASLYKGTGRTGSRQHFWSIGLGILLALLVMTIVLPLLLQADSGNFLSLLQRLGQPLRWVGGTSPELIAQLMLAVPTALYLFGLVAGSAHKRGAPGYQHHPMSRVLGALRIIPSATVYTLLGLVSGVYIVFILSQLPYFFSAFSGTRPEGWLVYSEYARNGFFELCRIATINLSILAFTNLSIGTNHRESLPLKLLNVVLSSLTLLLIATAFSKMALYIGVYGLSMRRLLPCVFMILLATICVGVILRQNRRFSILRVAAVTGAILICTLSVVDADALVANYNAERYLAGTLPGFDVTIVHRAGPAGIDAALRVYEYTQDRELRAALWGYLEGQYYDASRNAGRSRDTLQHAQARKRLSSTSFARMSSSGY